MSILRIGKALPDPNSRIILICLMFIGRVGGLTLIYAALSRGDRKLSRFPEEHITVG